MMESIYPLSLTSSSIRSCELHDHNGKCLDWFTVSAQHAFQSNGELSTTKFNPAKGAKEFRVLKEIVEASDSTPDHDGGVLEPDGFSQVYETVKEIHLGTREETGEFDTSFSFSLASRSRTDGSTVRRRVANRRGSNGISNFGSDARYRDRSLDGTDAPTRRNSCCFRSSPSSGCFAHRTRLGVVSGSSLPSLPPFPRG